jgi:hypothetical protein
MKRPENRVCADCHVNTHPRWTSWSLGVFICIRCSGIHRGLGTHISRVKSADLDAWTDEQIQMMVKWGNRRANTYQPPDQTPYLPPPPHLQPFLPISLFPALRKCQGDVSPSFESLDVHVRETDIVMGVDTGKPHCHPATSPRAPKWKTISAQNTSQKNGFYPPLRPPIQQS